MSHRISLCAAACLVALLLTCPASAGDGVLEINQACALNTGCFPGDGAGFPVTITSPGSYVLTSSLSVATLVRDGITISTSDVQIDLNGFEIVGVSTCTGAGSTLGCADAAANIHAIDGGSNDRIEVHSGRLRRFPDRGLKAGQHVRVYDLLVQENGLGGIELEDYAAVRDTTAAGNGGDGIKTGSACTIERAIANHNLLQGIDANNGCTVSSSSAWFNGDTGISITFGSVVSNSSAYINGGDGFSMRGTSLMRGCTAYRNGVATDFQVIGTNGFAIYQENALSRVVGQPAYTSGVINGGGNFCDGLPCP